MSRNISFAVGFLASAAIFALTVGMAYRVGSDRGWDKGYADGKRMDEWLAMAEVACQFTKPDKPWPSPIHANALLEPDAQRQLDAIRPGPPESYCLVRSVEMDVLNETALVKVSLGQSLPPRSSKNQEGAFGSTMIEIEKTRERSRMSDANPAGFSIRSIRAIERPAIW